VVPGIRSRLPACRTSAQRLQRGQGARQSQDSEYERHGRPLFCLREFRAEKPAAISPLRHQSFPIWFAQVVCEVGAPNIRKRTRSLRSRTIFTFTSRKSLTSHLAIETCSEIWDAHVHLHPHPRVGQQAGNRKRRFLRQCIGNQGDSPILDSPFGKRAPGIAD